MTIVIRKVGTRRFNVSHYAPGHAPVFVEQMRSKQQAQLMGEWYALRLAQVQQLQAQAQEQARVQDWSNKVALLAHKWRHTALAA